MFDKRSHSTLRSVDLGIGDEPDEEAKNALTFMTVGVQRYWKAPVAFNPTSALTAEPRAVVLQSRLENVVQCCFTVRSLMTDGHASNRSRIDCLEQTRR